MSPILQLEINEIPWRILNHYRSRHANIEWFFNQSRELTTKTVDEGELSPWVTWPTLHRGLPNTKHQVFNLGQDPTTFKGTPIWEEYRKAGHSIGIFGSMQSWPPMDPGPNGFWVPDTFAHDEKTIPPYIEPLQRFNLDQVANNGRVVTGSSLKSAINHKFFASLIRSGVRPRTVARLIKQLAGERKNPALRARRPIFQTILFWDVFKHLFNPKNPPAYSTFFTNHVAGVMHRYWNHLFPEDFPDSLKPKERIHHDTMDFAMNFLDEMLGDVRKWMKANPKLSVIFATSMGQGPVHRLEHHGLEAVVRDIPQLMFALGLQRTQFEPLLAMVPQIAVEFPNPATRWETKQVLESIKTVSQKQLFTVQEIGNSLSITLKNPSAEDCQKQIAILPDGSQRTFDSMGIKVWETEAGAAYHIPEGIFAVAGPLKKSFLANEPTRTANEPIPADQIKGLLLEAVGLKAPALKVDKPADALHHPAVTPVT